jgi:hypothetical protein
MLFRMRSTAMTLMAFLRISRMTANGLWRADCSERELDLVLSYRKLSWILMNTG